MNKTGNERWLSKSKIFVGADVTQETNVKLERLAAERDQSKSAIVRAAIRDYLAKEQAQ